MSAPSMKTLKRFFPDEQAKRLRALMTGRRDPMKYGRVESWVNQCHNMPSDDELIMAAIDEELEGFGVEAIRGRHVDNYHFDTQAVYVNQGGTYDITILHDNETGNYILTAYGDWFQSHERTRELT